MHNATPKEVSQVRMESEKLAATLQRVETRLMGNMDKGEDLTRVRLAYRLLIDVVELLR